MPRAHPAVLSLLALPALALSAACRGAEVRHVAGPDLERFAWFRELPGRWIATEDSSAPGIEVAYRLTAGGHVLEETMLPGTGNEMVTMIHPEPGGLALTHYCALGNQPRMRALPSGSKGGSTGEADAGREVDFRCTGAPAAAEGDMHMHRVVYAFPGDGRVRSTWSLFEAGELVEVKRFDLVRLPEGREAGSR